jgi:hypothetical protein
MRAWYQRKSLEERRQWIALRDPVRVRADDSARHQRMKGDADYEARRRAIATVNNAIRAGKLVREACENCGDYPTHGHHDDYSRPLDVRWLCPPCHAAQHAEGGLR